MSVYDNDKSKIYPTLDPSAPPSQEVNPQTYRLAKISAKLKRTFSMKLIHLKS